MGFEISGTTIIDQDRQLLNVGVITATALDISGDVDIDGTLEADAITVDGTALDTHIAGVTVTNATNAANVAITDDTSGSGTHYLHFGSATSSNDGVEVDSTRLVYKDGDVGIGTNAPQRGPLHVHENSSSDCQIHLTNNDTGSSSTDGLTIYTDTDTSGIWSREDVDFQIATNSTERLRIDKDGNIGIGTVDPTNLLHVYHATKDDLARFQSGDSYAYISFADTGQTGSSVPKCGGHGDDFFVTTSGVEKFRITSTGAIAIEGSSNYGSSGQVLTSNGNDAPTWQDASGGGGGSSKWTSVDQGIYPTTLTNNIGIGTTNPSAMLEIGSSGIATSNTVINAQAWDGQVFNIDGNITSGSIFSVNDISGLPVIDFNATHGQLSLGAFGGNVSIGYTNAGTKLGLKGSTSERVHIVADELSDMTDDTINIDNGNVQYFTTAEDGGTLTPDITSNNGINNDLAIGDSVTVVVIIKPDSADDKITNITIDGSAATEEWLGGSAPTGGASGSYDVYTFFILKTADATFLPLCNKVNYA